VPGCASAQPRGKLTSPSGEGSPYHLDPDGAVPAEEGIAREALRTIPPRETAGNIDIKQISPGASVLLPAYVPGGLVSTGDAHYAQGAYEASGMAIEMRSRVHLRFGIRKGEVVREGIRDLQFFRDDYFTSPEMAAPRRFFATTGISVARTARTRART
jgi:formamidase